MLIEQLSEMRKKQIGDYCYLAILSVYLLEAFLKTTTFQIIWPTHFHGVLQCGLFAFVLVKLLCIRKQERKYVLGMIVVIICFVLSARVSGYSTRLLDALLLILGAYQVSFRKILGTYLVILVPAILITAGAALSGNIENLVYIQGNRSPRMAFGIGYPTDFAAYLFFGAVTYCMWKRSAIGWLEIVGIELLAVFCWCFCDARNSAVCLGLMGIGITVMKVCSMVFKREREGYYLPDFIQILCVGTPIIFPVLMWIVTLLYGTGMEFVSSLNDILSNRLLLGYQGIKQYGMSLFGQQIPMVGFGMSTEWPDDYFFIDSSYILIGLRYGMALLLITCALFLLYLLFCYQKGKVLYVMLIAIVLLQCMFEHHFLEVVYNPILLAAGTQWIYLFEEEKQNIGRIG